MKREEKKVREIQQSLDNIAALKAEAKYISSFIYKKPKKKEPIELYSRPWESIVIKPKAK
jgi:hypothetical protein